MVYSSVGWVCQSRKSRVTGKFCLGEQNESGQKLTKFHQENALIIEYSISEQNKRQVYTWTSPNGQYRNQNWLHSVQFSSVSQSCPTLCDPMNRSTPGLLVHHKRLEFTQTHVHRVGDAIQQSHPLSSPSPPAPNPSQHPGLFQWVNSSPEVAKVLEFSFSISPSNEHPGLICFRMDWLDLLAVQGTLCSQ